MGLTTSCHPLSWREFHLYGVKGPPMNRNPIRTTAPSQIRVIVESLPQVVDGLVAGFGTSVNENT